MRNFNIYNPGFNFNSKFKKRTKQTIKEPVEEIKTSVRSYIDKKCINKDDCEKDLFGGCLFKKCNDKKKVKSIKSNNIKFVIK